MITTETPRGRWITLRNGNRALAFGTETDAQAQARYDRIAANSEEITFGYGDAEVETPQPRKIRFDGHDCRRCEGEGRSAHWRSYSNNGTCYRCMGAGFFLSAAGQEARDAYEAALTTTYGALAEGERFEYRGKVYRKGDPKALPADREVRHAEPAVKRRVMVEIAARYPGATLVY